MGYTLQQLQQMGAQPGVNTATPVNQPTPQNKMTFEELQSMGAKPGISTPPIQDEPKPEGEPGLMSKLGKRFSDIKSSFTRSIGPDRKITPISGALQGVGAVAGGINDIVGAGIEKIPYAKGLMEDLGKGVGKISEKTGVSAGIGKFQQAHPEISADIGAVGNIVGAAGLFTGAGALKNTLSKAIGSQSLKAIATDITPEVTSKIAAKGIAKEGTTQSLIRGVIKPVVTKTDLADAEVISKNVPGFGKLKTFSDKVNATRNAELGLRESLKNDVIQSGKDRIYPFKELASKIDNAPEPISLKGTPFEKQIKPLKMAVIQMAQKNGGKISSLFDTTKEFDALVNKTWPNLWDKENAPMRNAVKAVRDTINKYIDDNLPEGTNFLERRLEQHKLINAIENMSEKASSELGTTRLQRLGQRHPIIGGLLKKTGKYALEGAGLGVAGGAGYDLYHNLRGQ